MGKFYPHSGFDTPQFAIAGSEKNCISLTENPRIYLFIVHDAAMRTLMIKMQKGGISHAHRTPIHWQQHWFINKKNRQPRKKML